MAFGLPSLVMATSLPAKSLPTTVGATMPMAGSALVSVVAGRAPVTWGSPLSSVPPPKRTAAMRRATTTAPRTPKITVLREVLLFCWVIEISAPDPWWVMMLYRRGY